MLDIGAIEASSQNHPAVHTRSGKVLRMAHNNDRMAGSVPVWEKASSATQRIEESLGRAQTSSHTASFENALAYQGVNAPEPAAVKKPFGFGDLIDMVNPLQHIPVVSNLYRHFTGDEIRPISTIIGGAVFGGAAGAASGLVNAAIQEETGKDLTGNVLALVLDGETPQYKSAAAHPETQIAASLKDAESGTLSALPGSVLSFADLGGGRRMVFEMAPAAEGRTAGMMRKSHVEKNIHDLASAAPLDLIAPNAFPLFEDEKKTV